MDESWLFAHSGWTMPVVKANETKSERGAATYGAAGGIRLYLAKMGLNEVSFFRITATTRLTVAW